YSPATSRGVTPERPDAARQGQISVLARKLASIIRPPKRPGRLKRRARPACQTRNFDYDAGPNTNPSGGFMELFATLDKVGHEEVVFFHSKDTGLKAIVAIHNTVLGPALGGCRMWPYKSEAEALNDVLRLSKGMTYKAAVSGLNLGGGKSVIIGDPLKDKTEAEAFFRSFGRFIESLNGRYITAE